MALTDALPGPNGLTDSIEAGKDLAGLLAHNPDGSPRPGILSKGPGNLITGRSDMRVDIAPFKAALVRNGAVRLIANDSPAQSPAFTVPTANSRIDVLYVKVGESALVTAETDGSFFGILPGTASPIPEKPTLNIDGALELGTVRLTSGATGTATAIFTQTAQFTAAAGGAWDFEGIDSAGWVYRTGPSGKRIYYRFYDSWAGSAFGAAGGSNWSQARATGIAAPTGKDFNDFLVDVNVWPQATAQNMTQAVIQGYLSGSTGTGTVSLLFYNPTGLIVANTFMNLRASITLTEK